MINFSVFLISLSALSYEVLLIRLLSIERWQDFVTMIIGLALLGYGASGTFVHLTRKFWEKNLGLFTGGSACDFALSAFFCFIFSQMIPFNPMDFLWNSGQFFYLLGLSFLFILPFFFAATTIGSLLSSGRFSLEKLYASDLLGAGVGGGLIVFFLNYIDPYICLKIISTLALLGSLPLFHLKGGEFPFKKVFNFLPLFLMVFIWSFPLKQKTHSFKPLEKIKLIPETNVKQLKNGPMAQLHLLESEKTPFRHAPGLSLKDAPLKFPKQWALFKDGMGFTVFHPDGFPNYVKSLTSALPYALDSSSKKKNHVLLLTLDDDTLWWQAYGLKAKKVTAVFEDERIFDLFLSPKKRGQGNFVKEKWRVYLNQVKGKERFALIQVPLSFFKKDSGGPTSLKEDYNLTKESFGLLFESLEEKGQVVFNLPMGLPPKKYVRLLGNLSSQISIETLKKQLMVIRNWDTLTLLFQKGPLEKEQLKRLKTFSQKKNFDLVYYPGIEKKEANHFHRLKAPLFYEVTQKILSNQGKEFLKGYKYKVDLVTDNNPFFFDFYKSESFLELWKLRKRGGMGLLDWGPLFIGVLIIQIVFLGGAFILLPLILSKKKEVAFNVSAKKGLYFFLIGLAFFFVEITLIKRFIPLLGYPLLSLVFVLVVLLLGSGCGSYFLKWRKPKWPFCLFFIFYGTLVGGLFFYKMDLLLNFSSFLKYLLVFLFLFPLGFMMGMPFPLGLDYLKTKDKSFIPWAWAINGLSSVFSIPLVTLVSINFSLGVTFFLGLIVYGVAFRLFAKNL